MILTHLALFSFFEGATEADAPPVVVEETTAGGIPRRKRDPRPQWPRRVIIDGTRYWVRSPAELRRLLEARRAELEAEIAERPDDLVPRRRKVRIERRIQTLDRGTRDARRQKQIADFLVLAGSMF